MINTIFQTMEICLIVLSGFTILFGTYTFLMNIMLIKFVRTKHQTIYENYCSQMFGTLNGFKWLQFIWNEELMTNKIVKRYKQRIRMAQVYFVTAGIGTIIFGLIVGILLGKISNHL